MNRKVSLTGIVLVFIGCILLAVFRPLEDQLGGQGQWTLTGIIFTLGLWIFKPFGIPFSAGAIFLQHICWQ